MSVAVVGLLLTTLMTWAVHDRRLETQRDSFSVSSQEVGHDLVDRVGDFGKLLQAAAQFAALAHPVSADELASWTGRGLLDGYPGMTGITIVSAVTSDQLDELVASRRAEGDSDFGVATLMPADDYFVITSSTVPGTPVGLDLGGSAERRAGFERARDSGRPAVTSAFTLVVDQQLPAEQRQLAFAIYAPIYRAGAATDTVTQRRAALLGFTSTALRGQEFLDDADLERDDVSFALFEGPTRERASLIGLAGEGAMPAGDGPGRTVPVTVGGQRWTMRTVSPAGLGSGSWLGLWGIILPALGLVGLATALVQQQRTRALRRRHTVDEAVADASAAQAQRQLIFETAQEGLVLQDAEGRILEWNPATESMLGLTGDQLAGRTAYDPIFQALDETGAELRADDHPTVVARCTGVPVVDRLVGMRRPDKSVVWLIVNAHPLLHEATGSVTGVVASFVDVTGLRIAEAASRASLDALEQGVALSSLAGEVVMLNDAGERILGYDRAALSELFESGRWETYREDGSVLPPEERPVRHTMDTGEAVRDMVVVWPTRAGTRVTLRVTTQPVLDLDGSTTGVVTAFADVTAELAATRELAATQERFEALVARSNDVLCLIDEAGTLTYSSPAGEQLLGYPTGSFSGQPFVRLLHPDDAAMVVELFAELRERAGSVASIEARVQAASGEWRHMEVVATNRLEDPAVRGIVANVRDVTERAEAAAKLAWLAFHDPLTDLPNRTLLLDRLEVALRRSARSGHLTALMFVDLDGFKEINDERGHATGDQLLIEVAVRLASVCRAGDTVARLGGDEFVLLAEALASGAEAEAIAARIVDELGRTMHIDGNAVSVSASVGIAFDSDHEPDRLLREADTALYEAKAAGGNRFAIFGADRGWFDQAAGREGAAPKGGSSSSG